MSAWPNPQFPSWLLANDKLAHAGLYAVFGAALGYARHHDPSRPSHLFLIALGALYGATDEWHQAFVVGRTPGWGDWIADMTGVTLGYLVALLTLSRVARSAMPDTNGPSTNVPD